MQVRVVWAKFVITSLILVTTSDQDIEGMEVTMLKEPGKNTNENGSATYM